MNETMNQRGEPWNFARRAGVAVRALHPYERRASVLVGLQELDEIRHLLFTNGGFKPLGHQGERTGGDRLNILAENVILLAAGATEGDAGVALADDDPGQFVPILAGQRVTDEIRFHLAIW